MSWLTILLFASNTTLSLGGLILLKSAHETANPTLAALGASLWAMTSVLFIELSRIHDVGTLAIVSQALGLTASIAVGVLIFEEAFTNQKIIAATLVVSAVIVAGWPTNSP